MNAGAFRKLENESRGLIEKRGGYLPSVVLVFCRYLVVDRKAARVLNVAYRGGLGRW